MNQERWIQDFFKNYTVGWLEEDEAAIEKEFPVNRDKIITELSTSISQICNQAGLQQNKGCKGSASWLSISFLRTNILDDIWQYRLDLYDENLFFDRMECAAYWDMHFVWDYLKKRLDELNVAANTGIYANKIRTNHLTKVKLVMAERYHKVATEMTKMIIKDAIKIPEYTELIKGPYFRITIGEYLDQNELIYEEQLAAQV